MRTLYKDYTDFISLSEFTSFTGNQNFFTRAAEITTELQTCPTDASKDRIVGHTSLCAGAGALATGAACVTFADLLLVGSNTDPFFGQYDNPACPVGVKAKVTSLYDALKNY